MKNTFFVAFVLIIIALCQISASAINTGFVVEKRTDNIKVIDFSRISAEPTPLPIDCFDVNDNGKFAIGYSEYSVRYICIYSPEGEFEYGYKFTSSGDWGVEWSGDNLLICILRSAMAYELDSMGNVVDVYDILDTKENRKYWDSVLYSPNRTVNNKIYELKNDMGILNILTSSYSQLICTDGDGNTKMIIDHSSQHFEKIIVCIICFVAIIGLSILMFYYNIKNFYKRNTKR